MKILVSGLNGHMGREVAALLKANCRGMELAAGVDINHIEQDGVPCAASFADAVTDVDCVVDFSHHTLTKALLDFAVQNRLRLVLATTGQTDEERQMIADAAKEIPLFFAANYSLGIAVLTELAKKAAAVMPDAEIEIIEMHHDRKVDAPSGTALSIGRALQTVRPGAELKLGRSGMGKREPNEIGISAIRMGNLPGIHEVLIGTQNETITLKHEAHNRTLLAEGALAAADFLKDKPAGLYDMQSLLAF